MSSDSSEEEISEHLREAIDARFLDDNMFRHNGTFAPKKLEKPSNQLTASHNPLKKEPSLRPNTNLDDQFDLFGVTPQFQQYVAKQLSLILEKKLDKMMTTKYNTVLPHKCRKSRVRLLKNSTKFLKVQTVNVSLNHPICADNQINNNGLFDPNSTSKQSQELHPHSKQQSEPFMPSQRDKEDHCEVLSQLQQHVANQLELMLDKHLQKRITTGNSINSHHKHTSGIRFFRNSVIVRKLKNCNGMRTVKRPAKISDSDKSDDEKKCSEVAVDPDYILSKKGVESWATSSKAVVFKYQKSKNGTLTSID